MPFRSQAQRAFLYSQHPDIAKRWAKITPNLHITVILDKIEKQNDLTESDISALAAIANV